VVLLYGDEVPVPAKNPLPDADPFITPNFCERTSAALPLLLPFVITLLGTWFTLRALALANDIGPDTTGLAPEDGIVVVGGGGRGRSCLTTNALVVANLAYKGVTTVGEGLPPSA